MNISVMGCGRWGSFIAWYLGRICIQVTLYGRKRVPNIWSNSVRHVPTDY